MNTAETPLTNFSREYFSFHAHLEQSSLELASQVGLQELEGVLRTFFQFMSDEKKWRKVQRMCQSNPEVETQVRVFVCALQCSFQAVPMIQQLMRTNTFISEMLGETEHQGKAVHEIQKGQLVLMMNQLRNFLEFVELNIQVETNQLSEKVVEANKLACLLKKIESMLELHGDHSPFIRAKVSQYSQVSVWLKLGSRIPSDTAERLDHALTTLLAIGHVGSLPPNFVLTSVRVRLHKLFQELDHLPQLSYAAKFGSERPSN